MVAFDNNAADKPVFTRVADAGPVPDEGRVRRGVRVHVGESLSAGGSAISRCRWYFTTPISGHVFCAGSSWDEDATWIGFFDGHLQLFRDGHIEDR